jgi:hypothetical protein
VGLFRHLSGGVGGGWTLIDVETLSHSLQDCWSIAYAGPQTWVLASIDSLTNGVGHVWKSADDGKTWAETTTGFGSASSDVGRITVTAAAQSSGPWRVYALASNKQGSDQKDVFRSNDGGATWQSLAMFGCGTSACSTTHLTNPTDGLSGPHQPDLDFIHGQAAYNQMLVADPLNPDIVFIGGNLAMGRSTDGGANWTVMTDWLPFDLTTTGGLDNNPNTMAQYAHADWHTGTVAHAGIVAWFYGGNDGGLIRAGTNVLTAAPGSVTWEDKLNRGIVSHLIYSVASGKERLTTACAAGGGDIVWGGFQDNGTRLRVLSGGTNYVGYNQVIGGDGFGVALGCNSIDPAMGSQLFSTYVDQISVSKNSGGSFTRVVTQTTGLNPPITLDYSLNFKMKVVADLSDDKTYLTPVSEAATQTVPVRGHVYRSIDNGATWIGINGTIHTEAATNIVVWPKPMRGVAAHLHVSNLYAAVSGGRVYVTTDGGTNWYESKRAVSTNATNYLSLFSVALDPNDATGNTVWAATPATSLNDGTLIPAGVGHLFKCTKAAGVAGASCTPRSSGIPEAVPVNVVKVDPNPLNSSTIYAGTEIGLYRSIDGGASFSRYGTGLPLVNVTDVAVNADDSAIRVSTFGRGFWEIYPSTSVTAGVAGNGDLDNSGIIDGFDLVREAAIEFSDRTTADFNAIGDLFFDNKINDQDLNLLIAKLGKLP